MADSFAVLVDDAQSKFEAGDFLKCETILLAVLTDESKKYADIYNKLGYIACQKNNLEEGVEHYKKALAINPQYTEASLNLAVTYNELGKFQKAIEVFENAIEPSITITDGLGKCDPYILGKLANEHMLMGDKYFNLRMIDFAMEEYNKALNLRPKFADIVNKLGIALREKGDIDESIRIFQKAISLNEKYFTAHIQLGIAYYSKGFLDMAIDSWDKAAQIDPASKEAKLYLSIARKK